MFLQTAANNTALLKEYVSRSNGVMSTGEEKGGVVDYRTLVLVDTVTVDNWISHCNRTVHAEDSSTGTSTGMYTLVLPVLAPVSVSGIGY